MQCRPRCKTKPSDVASIRLDLRLDENNVEHNSSSSSEILIFSYPRTKSETKKKSSQLRCDEFLQLHDIGCESADPLACFFVRHSIVVQHPAERLFIQPQLFNVC